MLKMLPAECEKTYRTHPKSNVCLTCHVISQSAFTTRESNFGGNNVSFDINFKENKIFKYVQMTLPKKKIFKCFFFVMKYC